MAKPREKLYAGVMGFPVSHSWSPSIFSLLARILDDPLDYRTIEVDPVNWEESVSVLQNIKIFHGWNVTLPFKEKFLNRVDVLSSEARAVGAVNVVKVSEGGKLWGYNTDVFGVQRTLEEQKFRAQGKCAVIFGAGGASLAVAYALGSSGASDVWIVNRTIARARSQAKRLRTLFPKTVFHACEQLPRTRTISPQLYVNATPLGMVGFPRESLLPKSVVADALVFDLVYHPEKTPFLASAEKLGVASVGGLDMLLWQALASWEIWVGKVPQLHKVKNELKQQLVTLRKQEYNLSSQTKTSKLIQGRRSRHGV